MLLPQIRGQPDRKNGAAEGWNEATPTVAN